MLLVHAHVCVSCNHFSDVVSAFQGESPGCMLGTGAASLPVAVALLEPL